MSGILIRVKGASFEANAVGFIPPIAGGLEYMNFFGGDANKATRNLAPGKPAAGLVGAPTYNEHSAIFRPGANYVVTSVDDAESMTFIAVAKSLSDANTMIVSNFSGPRAGGVGTTTGKALDFGSNGVIDGLVTNKMFGPRWDGVSSAPVSPGVAITGLQNPVGEWRAVVGRARESDKTLSIFNKTAGLSGSVGVTQVADLGASKMRIGGTAVASGGSFANAVEIAAVAIYSRALTDVEIDKVYSFLKGYYSRRGMAI